MGLVITVLLLGVLASLSPTTLVVFILLLATTRARLNAAAFLIGWGISLTLVFAVSFAIGSTRTAQHGSGRRAVDMVEILLGVALLFFAVRQWRRRNRPRTHSSGSKGFTARLNNLRPWQATMVGVIKQPWSLTAAAAVVVVHHHDAIFIAVIAFLVFTLVSTATVSLIFLYSSRRPGKAEAHLSVLKDRLVRSGPQLAAAMSLLIGVLLVVDGATAIRG